MNEPRIDEPARGETPPADAAHPLAGQVGAQARRKLHARGRGAPGVWSGLGVMGLVGWSVVVPTLFGAALGRWLDAHTSGRHRWTLALLVAGLVLGCFNAWHWIEKEDRAIQHDAKDDDHGSE